MANQGQTGRLANGQSVTRPVGSDFRRQLLGKKAQDFAADSARLVARLPRTRSADVIGNQLLRASTSIAANVAEGYGRYSQAAYRNHLSVARGSAFETESWLDLLFRLEYLTEADAQALINRSVELQKLLTIRMKSLTDGKTYAVRDESLDYEA